MVESKQVAQTIKVIAKEKGIMTTKMLLDLGLNKNMLSTMNQGSMPDTENLIRIADYLTCTVGELLGEKTKKSPADSEEPTGGKSALDAEILRATARLSDEAKRKILALLLEFQQDVKL